MCPPIEGRNPPRGPYAPLEAQAISQQVAARSAEYGQALRFIYLPAERGWRWKDGLERYVRQSCDTLGIQRRGVHGFRATAACEFVDLKRMSGYTEFEARRELAVWLGHNPQRTEVTYAYVPHTY